jgi:hypothetical protein
MARLPITLLTRRDDHGRMRKSLITAHRRKQQVACKVNI